ncbi:FAD binding domain-containing protein [Amycolatopsis sp. NPDC051903]|uniref:FAD binding domain-containing protein n=1 Tax=Amycolatopsis sp. NPDC051903 TaxID=3363936 RepID=UPI0037AF0009
MIPAPFALHRPDTVEQACAALDGHGSDAEVLAGGQSLIADLKLRRKSPRLLVDLSSVAGLDGITVEPGRITIGAMARQAAVVTHPEVSQRLPLLPQVARAAADPMVRTRGTLVGACCQAAAGGDWVAAALALDGTVVIEGGATQRELSLQEFVLGEERTALRPGEIARSLRIPTPGASVVMTYRKVKHVSVGWSVASAAIVLPTRRGEGRARIAVSGAVTHPQRLPELESALADIEPGRSQDIEDAVETALAPLEYRGDYYASAAYRKRRLAVLLRRSITELVTPSSS